MVKLRTRFRIFMDSAEIQGFSQDSAGFRDLAHKFSASGKDSDLNSSLN